MAGYDKPDFWSLKARKEGYPARSVYKLAEIASKFGLLPAAKGGGFSGAASAAQGGAASRSGPSATKAPADAVSAAAGSGPSAPNAPADAVSAAATSAAKAQGIGAAQDAGAAQVSAAASSQGAAPGPAVLDIGAAPGSWSLWLLRNLAGRGRVVAVDIQDMNIPAGAANFRFIKGSILDPVIRQNLSEGGPYSLVVSDAAPSTTGNRLVDQSRSEELVEAVKDLALEVLAPGGALVMKIFQGGEEKRLITELKKDFSQARGFKPEACRSISFETYLVATGFRGFRRA